MKRTIIANWGHANQGKTDTIKRLVQIILKHYPSAITDPSPVVYGTEINVIISLGELKIGIESLGDPNSKLFENLEAFTAKNCDIIICATRTSGATVNAVVDTGKTKGYDVVWVTNYRSSEKDKEVLNQVSAEHHFQLLEKIINGNL